MDGVTVPGLDCRYYFRIYKKKKDYRNHSDNGNDSWNSYPGLFVVYTSNVNTPDQ